MSNEEERAVKFMAMHKHDPHTEAGELPSPEFMAEMGTFIEGMARSGQLLDGEGLGATKTRARVSLRGGQPSVTHGPYQGTGNELPASIAKIAVAAPEEAIAWAKALGTALGDDVELEVGQITEAWDLGFWEKPADAPIRYLVVNKVTEDSKAGRVAALAAAAQRVSAPGALLASVVLTPTSEAKQIAKKGNQRTVLDGPFTESKELIGGYAILEMPSMDECLEVCLRYADILGSGGERVEVDIRPLHKEGAP